MGGGSEAGVLHTFRRRLVSALSSVRPNGCCFKCHGAGIMAQYLVCERKNTTGCGLFEATPPCMYVPWLCRLANEATANNNHVPQEHVLLAIVPKLAPV